MLDHDSQMMIVNAAAHAAQMAAENIRWVAASYARPSAIYRPSLSIDGNKWCALYGENLQDGVAGFGDSPEAAMLDFDSAWGVVRATQEQEQ